MNNKKAKAQLVSKNYLTNNFCFYSFKYEYCYLIQLQIYGPKHTPIEKKKQN